MAIVHVRRYGWAGAMAFILMMCTSGAPRAIAAIDLDLDGAKIDEGLRIARSSDSRRATFHRLYQFATNSPSVERVEVITEYRRVVLIGEERMAAGDQMFLQSTRMVGEALRPYHRRVSIVARVRFPVQNAYVTAPSVDVTLTGPSGDVPRLDLRATPQYALGLGGPDYQQPLIGVDGEAVFDATAIGQTSRTVVIREGGTQLTLVTIDFSRLD